MKALALVLLVACGPAPSKPPTTTTPPPANAGEETFTGTITEADFGCAADASCDLVVDTTKRVHFGHDTRLEGGGSPWGNTEQIFTLMEDPKHGVGRKVEVFAAKKGDGYTLQGKTDYYIKVLP